jgi:hypothetical protein
MIGYEVEVWINIVHPQIECDLFEECITINLN